WTASCTDASGQGSVTFAAAISFIASIAIFLAWQNALYTVAGSQGYCSTRVFRIPIRCNARAFVVFHFDFPIVREHQPDIWCAIHEAGQLACTEYRIEFAINQHLVQRLARRDRLQFDVSA